jgi:hypothetical protein
MSGSMKGLLVIAFQTRQNVEIDVEVRRAGKQHFWLRGLGEAPENASWRNTNWWGDLFYDEGYIKGRVALWNWPSITIREVERVQDDKLDAIWQMSKKVEEVLTDTRD